MHYVFLCDDTYTKSTYIIRVRTTVFNSIFTFCIRVYFMKSIVFLLAFIAMTTSIFAQQQVLGQSPRSAKIYTKQVSNHQVLGQSPRSAKIYNSDYVSVAGKEEVQTQEQKSTHLVLGQSPRSAKIYNSENLLVAEKEEVQIQEQESTHLVLGQSPRSAKIHNSTYVPTHIVLGQSPRSAIVYNSDGYELWKYRNGVFNISLKSVK